jgi:hypothetical protein
MSVTATSQACRTVHAVADSLRSLNILRKLPWRYNGREGDGEVRVFESLSKFIVFSKKKKLICR